MDVLDVVRQAKLHPVLRDFRFFWPDDSIYKFAISVRQDLALASGLDGKITMPLSARLPSEDTAIVLHGGIYLLQEFTHHVLGQTIGIWFWRNDQAVHLGGYQPGGSRLLSGDIHSDDASLINTVSAFAFLISILNQPRIVRVEKAVASRQVHRQAHGMGMAVDAFSRVSWDLSKETIAKISADPSFKKMPLHWRRGHYRRAESHWKGAVQLSDAIRPEDRAGWWQFIEENWVGHPAFGFKNSIHAPYMSEQELARRMERPTDKRKSIAA